MIHHDTDSINRQLGGHSFAEMGYGQVWDRLCAGLGSLAPARPCASALRQARQRLGAAPLKALFELLAGPAPTLARSAVRYGGLLVVALDGTVLSVPDTAANLTAYARHRCPGGGGGYPQLRLLVLLACGTRTVIGAIFGTATLGETTWAQGLAGQLKTGMLLLADRNFAAQNLLAAFAGDGAHLLVRVKAGRRLPPIARLADGSFLARMGPLTVRVIDAEITLTTTVARTSGHYRLVTTLTDPAAHPALNLVCLYHQRWGATRGRTS